MKFFSKNKEKKRVREKERERKREKVETFKYDKLNMIERK